MNCKSVGLIGFGVSNKPLLKYFFDRGTEKIYIMDKKATEDEIRKEVEKLGFGDDDRIEISVGENQFENLQKCTVVFKSPVVKPDLPELVEAEKNGVTITSEMALFLELCPAKVFAVTGSDGKTTTTTLIYEMLKNQGYNCYLGGNIGIPLLSKVDEMNKDDKVVLELSSFQLQTLKYNFDVSVITNISPNHLDRHKDMDEYIWCKQNVFRYQTANKTLVLNYDNDITRKCKELAKSNVFYFSKKEKTNGAHLLDEWIYFDDKQVVNINDITIPGMHNVENYMTAITAVHEYVDIETIRKVAKEFKGVEHRQELVRELNGVKYYNDAIASSPSRTVAALKAFKGNMILLAGGYDKMVGFEDMAKNMIDKVKCLILMGVTAPKIQKAYEEECKNRNIEVNIPIYNVKTLEEGVEVAHNVAKVGDIVIMSPGSASFDMFKNFEEKGKRFKELVNKL